MKPLGSSTGLHPRFPAESDAPYARWDPCTPISWRVNTRWAPKGAVADLTGAFARLHAATGLTFVYKGTTTLVPGTAAYDKANTNGYITVAWAPDGSSRLIPKAPRGYYGPMGVGLVGPPSATRNANGKHYSRRSIKGYVLPVHQLPLASPAVSAWATRTAGRAPEACWTCTSWATPSG